MRRLSRWYQRGERALLRWARFAGDVHFFWWGLRYKFRDALAKARDTIY